MEDLWGLVKETPRPKTLASADQVKSVAYNGDPVPLRGAVLVGVTEFDSPNIANLPYPLRDIQVLEERFRALKMDHVSVLTSAQKDPARKPKLQNIIHEIQDMRRRITPQGLLIVVVSTHGMVQDGALCLAPTDYDSYSHTNVLRVGDLSALISPNRGERGALVVDYSSHHAETARSFPEVAIDAAVPLPPTRVGFAFMCSPPRMPVSFSSKFASILDELIDRKLPICANAIFAIFDKHSERWMGSPKKQMILMSDRASSGRAPLFNWSLVSGLDTSRVSYVMTVSVPVPSVHSSIPDSQSICRLLKQAVPTLRIKGVAAEDTRRFIVKISGGPPSKGPRGDKAYYARELSAMCADKGLPKVDVIKAMFGKLICITAASSFEVVCRGFQSSRTLQSFNTTEAVPTIEYVGVLCRPEVQSPFGVHMTLDELCRRSPSLREPSTGLYIEELGQVEDGFMQDHPADDMHSQAESRAQTHASRPMTPPVVAAWGSGTNPPASDDEASPVLAKVESQPWGKPGPAVDEHARGEIARLEAALNQERAERKAMMDSFAQQLRDMGRGAVTPAELGDVRDAVKQLQHGQHALADRLDEQGGRSPERSPNRGGATLYIENEEWLAYQDQLKLLQIQLRDVQTQLPAQRGEQQGHLADVLRPEDPALQHGRSPRKTPSEMPQGRQIADISRRVSNVEQETQQLAAVLSRVQEATAEMRAQQQPPPHLHTTVVHADPPGPSIDDMRHLRQRIDRIEALGSRASMGTPPVPQRGIESHALSPVRGEVPRDRELERKVDMLQGVVDKMVGSVRGLQDNSDVRRLYNDMMLDDIDAQLQGRAPPQNAPTYLPSALRNSIQNMVGNMIQAARDQIEQWTSTQVGQQRDQLGAMNTATSDQLHALQLKLNLLQSTVDAQRSNPHDAAMRESSDQVLDSHGKQLHSNLSAIHGLEQTVALMQNTVNSHSSRVQALEAGMDAQVAEVQNSGNDIRMRVDTAIQRVGQTVMEVEQKVMKDIAEAGARATVADQRIKHLDGRLAEDAERMHRIEDRIDQSTRVLQERLDEQAQKAFEVERRMTSALDDKMGVMRQIADVAEKNSVDLERRMADSEAQLKGQLRAALQQHIEGLEEVLQSMKHDLRGMDERTALMESIVSDCKVAGSLVDQKLQMTEKTVDSLRNGFETYVHDGTVHIMQAQNEKLDDLRTKLGHELDSFDARIKGIESQRKMADEELAVALEKIQVAVANQPSHDRVDRALAAMEEHRIRPALEAANKSMEMAREVWSPASSTAPSHPTTTTTLYSSRACRALGSVWMHFRTRLRTTRRRHACRTTRTGSVRWRSGC
eukprot:TRINITY_DN10424_c1_g1_i2.p1 TRINITY_DN10424_c1_g1~~TRINITY_DN10424_c1_g1_i2.p1  ORF type:complete len:1360 (+),score=511.72 TRINITY_DN10424_c1_g1_i2:101-4081(+)